MKANLMSEWCLAGEFVDSFSC